MLVGPVATSVGIKKKKIGNNRNYESIPMQQSWQLLVL